MSLFDTAVDFRGVVYRNIVSVRVSIDPFDDLLSDRTGQQAAIAAEMRVRQGPPGIIHRGFAYYAVDAQGLFLDLRGKETTHPDILGDDYAVTQAIGKRVAREGLPGLLYPSARWPTGECLAAFRPEALAHPRELYCLTYRIHAAAGYVDVERVPQVRQQRLTLDELRRKASFAETAMQRVR